MKLTQDVYGFYAGINKDGEIVQVFASCDDFENRKDSVVSLGYVEAIPVDYEEVFYITKE